MAARALLDGRRARVWDVPLVGGSGNSNVHPEIAAVIDLHDRKTKSAVGSELALGDSGAVEWSACKIWTNI